MLTKFSNLLHYFVVLYSPWVRRIHQEATCEMLCLVECNKYLGPVMNKPLYFSSTPGIAKLGSVPVSLTALPLDAVPLDPISHNQY